MPCRPGDTIFPRFTVGGHTYHFLGGALDHLTGRGPLSLLELETSLDE